VRERIRQELELLRKHYPRVDHAEQGGEDWFRIHDYPIPQTHAWGQDRLVVAFKVGAAHPGPAPYGFFVPSGLRFKGAVPGSYTDRAEPQPPFPETVWGHFSWQQVDGQWRATGDLVNGSNLLNYAQTFADRFREDG
jgi:hypothetical protein